MIRVRIKATGQVQDMIPQVARAMIAGGTAEEVKDEQIETAALKRNEREQTSEKRVQVRRRA